MTVHDASGTPATIGGTLAMVTSGTDLTTAQIARMVDLSAVRANSTEDEVRAVAQMARAYRCACASTLPAFTPLLVELLCSQMETRVGGNVGFPAGGTTTAMKAAEASAFINAGCGELDMVIAIGMLLSGRDAYVLDDMRAVVEAADGVPVKVILECHYLSDDQIRRACAMAIEAGASFVKTSTGWTPTGATLENIALIKSCVGDAVAIKAAGGIRSLETIRQMYDLGRGGSGLACGPRR